MDLPSHHGLPDPGGNSLLQSPGPAPGAEAEADLNSWPYVDRRKTPDRRRRPTAWWDSLLGRRRRVRGRRKGESQNIYVDLYDQWDLILAAAIFSLNLLDALLTLVFLGQGGREVNPVMAELLGYGVQAFVLEKCLVVALCLVALVVHKTFALARVASYLLLGAYGVLTVYHLVLQLRPRAIT